MKHLALLLLCACLSLYGIAIAEPLTFPDSDFKAPLDAETLDFGELKTEIDLLIPYLQQFPKLKKVEMYSTPISAAEIDRLTEALPEVEFGWTIRFGDHEIRTDCTAFSTLHTRNSHTHSSEDFSVLQYCKQLKALDFGHNAAVDISWLSELTELRVLIIACNQIEDISPLANLTKLEYLEMFTNRIRDISPLQNLTHLLDLNIGYNWIEDLTPIRDMSQLKRLWMYNYDHTGVPSRSVVSTIQEWLPEVQINTVSAPTEGGWRVHPHFDVIHAMFRSPDGYEPFADSYPEENPPQIEED